MTNIIDSLKNEVLRLAGREAEGQVSKVRKIATRYRHEAAQLKRLLRQKERELSRLRKQQQVPTHEDPLAGMRFSARSVRSQRARLGLSAADYARLVSVTPLTILSWEQGKSQPRKAQFARLVALRGIPKKTALARLAQLSKKR